MVDVMDRRVTRSISNELRGRTWPPQQAQFHTGLYNKSGGDEEQDAENALTYGRNTSDELYLNNLINSAGMNTMEAASLEFLEDLQPPATPANPQTSSNPESPSAPRGDSEELLHNWLVVSSQIQNNGSGGASSLENRPEQSARRNEHDVPVMASGSPRTSFVDNGDSLNVSQYLTSDGTQNVTGGQKSERRNSREKTRPTAYSPLHPRKDGNAAVTRSQSAELRRQAQADRQQAAASSEVFSNGNAVGAPSPAVTSAGLYAPGIVPSEMRENGKDLTLRGQEVLLLPPLSSPVLNNNQQGQQQAVGQQQGQLVTSVVNLLKGSIERKKQEQKSQRGDWHPKEVKSDQANAGQRKARQAELATNTQGLQALDLRQQIQYESNLPLLGQLPPTSMALTQSPTASTGAALSQSAGKVTSDGPSPSGVKRGNADIYDNGTAKTDNRKRPDQLTRTHSINSSDRQGYRLNEIDGATKKRRVERQRKMAEAKGRGNAPPVPADLQEALKRCEAFEEEVRSLKLRLAFMNRKDSDQTKKIEELEKRNRELKGKNDKLSEKFSAVHYQAV